MTVSNKPGHRGEREVSRKTIARGMPGDFRCTCGDYTRVLTTHCTRGCGCIGHPAFPAPSVFQSGETVLQNSGASRRGNAESWPVIPGRCEASSPESRDSGSGANAPSRNDDAQTELSLAV